MSDVNKEMLNLTYEYFMKNRELLALKNLLIVQFHLWICHIHLSYMTN